MAYGGRAMSDEKKKLRIVIVGGVAGGASAAARARRHSEEAEIVLVERGSDVSFANCGLPYHISGEIPNRAALALQTPNSLRATLNLDVRIRTEAISIDREKKTVVLRKVDTGETETLSYDKLILAPGAHPIRPPLPGIDDPNVLTLRNLDDMDRIIQSAQSVDSATVVGAGFIGLEMAEQLAKIGKSITVVEMQPQVLPQLDAEMARPLQDQLAAHGIEVVLGDAIAAFEPSGHRAEIRDRLATGDHTHTEHGAPCITARLESGRGIQAGMAILSIGVRPESALAKEAGLDLGEGGHIVVDAHQCTSDPDIYAVGDVCESIDLVTGARSALPLGGPANRQGRTAADHIFLGEKAMPYPGNLGTSIVRVFELAGGVTGWTEKRLEAAGIEYQSVIVNATQHAGYYPGATPIVLKLLWAPEDGKVLGAQAIGKDGVDKRLDVIATAMRGKLTIEDLVHLEFAYAPPFGSAKDVVNIAGFAACNIRDGLLKPVASLEEIAGEQIIDVRAPELALVRPIPGAKNIPIGELRRRLDEIDRARPVYTICQVGKMSYFAARVLQGHGFDAGSLLGGAHFHIKQ